MRNKIVLYLVFCNDLIFKRGAYGEVKLAFEKNSCQKYAIKIIPKKTFTVNGKHQMVIFQLK